MATKKLKDDRYYWVRRHRSESGDSRNPTVTQPHWQPMLWDAKQDAFYTQGVYQGLAPTALAEIGDVIAPHGHSGRVPGVRFAVSNDGGKTGVAWREDVHEALEYLALQNANGGDYSVVAVKRFKRKTPKRP